MDEFVDDIMSAIGTCETCKQNIHCFVLISVFGNKTNGFCSHYQKPTYGE